MSKTQLCSNLEFTVGSKVFLLGEYLILKNKPALLASLLPKFKMSFAVSDVNKNTIDQSPIELLKNKTQVQDSYQFIDPFKGSGGFGASTAEFALYYYYLLKNRPDLNLSSDWQSVYRLYRSLFFGKKVKPSGADLVVQWHGGAVVFDPENLTVKDMTEKLKWDQLLVFQSTHQEGRKVATHKHLEKLSNLTWFNDESDWVNSLDEIYNRSIIALENNKDAQFGEMLTCYGDALFNLGLEDENIQLEKIELKKIPGVLGIKGLGAMQSDGLLLFLDQETAHQKNGNLEKILTKANELDLKPISNRGYPEKGIGVL